jgi:signal transduction histidine kinase
MFNLISNAIKFTPTGSITIYAKPLPDEHAVLMGVRDTGEGIPSDKLETIFDRFAQVDTNMTRRRMGMGLGLAICRELVTLHGGRIWAESPEGGAEFNFTLPLPDNPAPSEADGEA